jgi:enoyl-CoA hydratase/carnithine racemase
VGQADEAKEIRLVLEITTEADLLPRARTLAGEIAAKPPQALRLCKRLLQSGQRLGLDDFLDQCAGFQGMAHHCEDHLEAVNAFLEKRPPQFRGK